MKRKLCCSFVFIIHFDNSVQCSMKCILWGVFIEIENFIDKLFLANGKLDHIYIMSSVLHNFSTYMHFVLYIVVIFFKLKKLINLYVMLKINNRF